MLSIAEAIEQILKTVQPSPVVETPLSQARGLCLSVDCYADIDSPPFAKSMMDGFAIRLEDIEAGRQELAVLETVVAGMLPSQSVTEGTAIQIMTGAPIPQGTTAVVPVEQTQFDVTMQTAQTAQQAVPTVRIEDAFMKAGAIRLQQHILEQGENTRTGELVCEAGQPLEAVAIGALAEFGHANVSVYPSPRVAILATGDELVPPSEKPLAGQIRNSNESMLCGQIERAGGIPVPLGIIPDNRESLRNAIQEGLKCDVLLLSGGVSAGTMDFVPSELISANVKQVFHKVSMKPGKPLWFGVQGFGVQENDPETIEKNAGKNALNEGTVVFGLPGNPVSSMVCFELFVRIAIRKMMGHRESQPKFFSGALQSPYQLRGNRPVHHPAIWSVESGQIIVEPLNWKGSSDLRSTVCANCTILFEVGKSEYQIGDPVKIYSWH